MTTDTAPDGAAEAAAPTYAHAEDPADLTPQQRQAEVAGILAGGLRRLHARSALLAPTGPKTLDLPVESPPSDLMCSPPDPHMVPVG